MEQQMKILHILDSLNRGGAETLCLDVARNSASHGFELTFFASGGGDLEPEFRNSGVDIVRYHRRFPIDPFLVKTLRKVILDRNVAIAHAQQAVEAIHIYLATRGTNVKCVMSLQNYILDKKNRIATEWIVPRMDAVCPVSNSMQDWFRDGEGFTITDRYHVLPNGVDKTRLAPTRNPSDRSLKAELGLPESTVLLGMVGNFYPDERKDQLTICRALGNVILDNKDVHFTFVGSVHDGAENYYNECRRVCEDSGIAKNIHFVGKRSDIPDILSELDLFVFSSVQEGLPVAAVEALLMGVPMLISDIPPLMEVTGNINGEISVARFFETKNESDLTAKLIELLSERNTMKNLGRLAALETPKRYSIETHLTRLREIYEKII